MSTQDNDQPTVAKRAANNGPGFTLVINAAAIVDAAITYSANAHSNNSNAPSATATAQPSTETADAFITVSKSATEQELAACSREAKKAEAEKKRRERQKGKEVQQLCQLEETKNCPFEAIQLTADGQDIHKIGSMVWDNVELKDCYEYLKQKNIKYGCTKANKKLGSFVVRYLKVLPYKNAIISSCHTSIFAAITPVLSSIQKGIGTVV
ncbi:hypothetical protein ACHAW6_006751 [Cyclotella cf. meneghiniana]